MPLLLVLLLLVDLSLSAIDAVPSFFTISTLLLLLPLLSGGDIIPGGGFVAII